MWREAKQKRSGHVEGGSVKAERGHLRFLIMARCKICRAIEQQGQRDSATIDTQIDAPDVAHIGRRLGRSASLISNRHKV